MISKTPGSKEVFILSLPRFRPPSPVPRPFSQTAESQPQNSPSFNRKPQLFTKKHVKKAIRSDEPTLLFTIIATRFHGPVAEWLGRSLQNFVQRFKSARDLIYRFIWAHFAHFRENGPFCFSPGTIWSRLEPRMFRSCFARRRCFAEWGKPARKS